MAWIRGKSDVLSGVYMAIVEFHVVSEKKAMKHVEKCGDPLIVTSDSWKLVNKTRSGNNMAG